MITNRLASLAVLVMLTLLSLAVPVSAQNSGLTPELLSKMLDLIGRAGTDLDIPARVANPLGLSATDQAWPSRQIGYHETASGITHSMAVGRGNDQDIAVNSRKPGNIDFYRIRRDGTLATALIYDIQTRQFTERNLDEAQKSLDAEFAFWAGLFAKDK
jgi:hypothetical protein